MASPVVTLATPEEYLALERQAEYKSEYIEGEIIPMTGASRKHNLITLNVAFRLRLQLDEQPCEIYVSDMRVGVSPTAYTYPDVIVVCGEPQLEDKYLDTLLNPTVIIEVLSQSTQDYDRGLKFEHYRKLESLQEYLLIAQDRCHVEHFVRQPDHQWLFSEAKDLQPTIQLPSINCSLALVDVYAKVEIAGA